MPVNIISEPQVRLLSHTQNPLPVIYAAFRECYSRTSATIKWEEYLKEDPSIMRNFIQKVLESGHESPIEHVSFTFVISRISRVTSHQLVRHRIASYSQKSQRCVEENNLNIIIPESIKKHDDLKEIYINTIEIIQDAYNILINAGISKEDARHLLPNATETSFVVTMNCRSLLNFFKLRCCKRAQWEIRKVANLMLEECRKVLPEVFNYAGATCDVYGYCPENEKFSCGKAPTLKSIVERIK